MKYIIYVIGYVVNYFIVIFFIFFSNVVGVLFDI